MNLIPIDGDLQKKILKDCPYYDPYVISAGTYPGQKEDISTITVQATLIVSAKADEKTVYDLTASLFDHRKDITEENAKGSELTLEKATGITTVPYHRGAAKYFREQGYTVKTDKE